MALSANLKHEKFLKINQLCRDIQLAVGSPDGWKPRSYRLSNGTVIPGIKAMFFGKKYLKHTQRLIFSIFFGANGCPKELLEEWMEVRNLLRDRAAVNEIKTIWSALEDEKWVHNPSYRYFDITVGRWLRLNGTYYFPNEVERKWGNWVEEPNHCGLGGQRHLVAVVRDPSHRLGHRIEPAVPVGMPMAPFVGREEHNEVSMLMDVDDEQAEEVLDNPIAQEDVFMLTQAVADLSIVIHDSGSESEMEEYHHEVIYISSDSSDDDF